MAENRFEPGFFDNQKLGFLDKPVAYLVGDIGSNNAPRVGIPILEIGGLIEDVAVYALGNTTLLDAYDKTVDVIGSLLQ